MANNSLSILEFSDSVNVLYGRLESVPSGENLFQKRHSVLDRLEKFKTMILNQMSTKGMFSRPQTALLTFLRHGNISTPFFNFKFVIQTRQQNELKF